MAIFNQVPPSSGGGGGAATHTATCERTWIKVWDYATQQFVSSADFAEGDHVVVRYDYDANPADAAGPLVIRDTNRTTFVSYDTPFPYVTTTSGRATPKYIGHVFAMPAFDVSLVAANA